MISHLGNAKPTKMAKLLKSGNPKCWYVKQLKQFLVELYIDTISLDICFPVPSNTKK